jgi:uncharacterized SAM-binding protein YcdF (DUF218 family)
VSIFFCSSFVKFGPEQSAKIGAMITDQILEWAKTLWDYHHLNHKLQKSDCILVLGSHDLRVAERGASLYLEGWAPLLIFSGGLGNLTRTLWDEPEAEKFARIARQMGVPAEAILLEPRSTNTGENMLFTQQMLQEKQIDPTRIILVQKPYMERRSYATFKIHWPEKQVIVTSPPIDFRDYPTKDIPLERVIQILVGDLQRIKVYPEKGFQIFQEIPPEVWLAYESLLKAGFEEHLA